MWGRRPDIKFAMLWFLQHSDRGRQYTAESLKVLTGMVIEDMGMHVGTSTGKTILEIITEMSHPKLRLILEDEARYKSGPNKGTGWGLRGERYFVYSLNEELVNAIFPAGLSNGQMIPFGPFHQLPMSYQPDIRTKGPHKTLDIMRHLYARSAKLKTKTNHFFSEEELGLLCHFIHPQLQVPLLGIFKLLIPNKSDEFYSK